MKNLLKKWNDLNLVLRIVIGLVIGTILGLIAPNFTVIAIRSEERRVGKECRL